MAAVLSQHAYDPDAWSATRPPVQEVSYTAEASGDLFQDVTELERHLGPETDKKIGEWS